MLAGQTACLAAVLDLLIERKLVSRREVQDCLRALADEHTLADADPKSRAPIRHLQHIVRRAP